MLNIFYLKEVLKGKRLKELEARVVGAIADFAVVARINEKDKNETEDDGKSKEKKQNNNPWGCYAGHASQV